MKKEKNIELFYQSCNQEFWNVAVALPLRRNFCYRVNSQMKPMPGKRVLVSFGKKRLAGYLVEKLDSEPDANFKIKQVIEVLDEEPLIPLELFSFLFRCAQYYLHPLGEVLKTALPPGIDPKERKGTLLGPRVKAKKSFSYSVTPKGRLELEKLQKRAPVRAQVLTLIASDEEVSAFILKNAVKDASRHVRALVKDQLVLEKETTLAFEDYFSSAVSSSKDEVIPELTSEQQVAVKAITEAISIKKYSGFLLHGVTGSGKTEVYLRSIEKVLSMEKGAMVLVPEITLTPQLVDRYRKRFGSALAVIHSALSDNERFKQWQLLRSGQVKVVIGVRSAVFAPVVNLGLIIVDEEHDGSFKQSRGFCYNARDLTLLRASRENCVALLGSATPSLESLYNAHLGKLVKLNLTQRPLSYNMPEVEIIDLKIHRGGPGGQQAISGPLYNEIFSTLEKGHQAILFLNRRGFAPFILCKNCGKIINCDACSVSLTLHNNPSRLACHYCGSIRPVLETCPDCGSENLGPVGAGTQKVESLLKELFPEAKVARLDRDSADSKKAEKILQDLRDGRIDILVGTQMITKGHDFPNVTLVGVIHGDVGLHMPDFRSAERTFQLLTQVAGRCGRGELPGKAFVQTYCPEHPVIRYASFHDYDSFSKFELENRKELMYPPFGRLVALRLSSPDANRVEAAARELMSLLRDSWHTRAVKGIMMLGPAPSPLSFLQGRHRWQIYLKGRSLSLVREMVSDVLEWIEAPPRDVRIRVDVDPVSML